MEPCSISERVAKLEEFVAQVARLTKDGEESQGQEFILECDDAVDTLHELIDTARELINSKV